MKVSELTGALLDDWVACTQGWEKWDAYPDCWLTGNQHCPSFQHFKPSSDWGIGGPIIERELIDISAYGRGAWAAVHCSDQMAVARHVGDTPLVAAMRAYVATKFGDDVPDEVTA